MKTSQLNSEQLKVLQSEYCRRNFHYFLRTFWNVINTEPYQDNWHIKYLCEELQSIGFRVAKRLPKEHDLVINVPPGSSKSTIATIMFPAWLWTIDASIRGLTASYSGTLAVEHSVKSRDIIKSETFSNLFPDIAIRQDFDGKSHYKNAQNGERFATSVRGSVTGMHAHVILVDDPLNPKEATSEIERKKACDFMTATLATRKVDKAVTPTILIMQRLHESDPTGLYLDQLKEGKPVKHICLPAELSNDVKPENLKANYINGLLDPVRMPLKVLEGLRLDMGSYNYAGQMMQTPAPADGGIWKNGMLSIYDELPKTLVNGKEVEVTLQRLGSDWDLAYTEKQTNSASAFVTAGVYDKKMYITDLGFEWLEFPKLMAYMRSKQATHYIEAKASGKSAKQVLTNQGINAVEVKVDGGDKVARAQMATPYAEAGRIFVHRSLINKLLNDEKQGILRFPNNKNDDLHDAFVQSVNRLLNQPNVFTF